jgi:hypothetical protein
MAVAGGAIYADVKSGGTFSVTDNRIVETTATFSDCGAGEGYGGAIALHGVGDSGGIIFSGEILLFTGCYAQFGKEIFLGSNNFDNTFSKSTFDYDYDLSDVNNLVGTTWNAINVVDSPMILLYNYLCKSTKEYMWKDGTCVDYAECKDICSTGTDGMMKEIYDIYILFIVFFFFFYVFLIIIYKYNKEISLYIYFYLNFDVL